MISLIVPTRNRPDNINRLYYSWLITRNESELIIITDEDDINNYDFPLAKVVCRKRGNAVEKINIGAEISSGNIIGFCGDDCVIKTKDWEKKVEESMINELSLVYVSDGEDKHNVPNHIFMTKQLYVKLGWFAYPKITHCYTDHVWRKIGLYLNSNGGYYGKVKDVIFKHLHPDYNDDIVFDDVYKQAYNKEQAAKDKIIFLNYKPDFLWHIRSNKNGVNQ